MKRTAACLKDLCKQKRKSRDHRFLKAGNQYWRALYRDGLNGIIIANFCEGCLYLDKHPSTEASAAVCIIFAAFASYSHYIHSLSAGRVAQLWLKLSPQFFLSWDNIFIFLFIQKKKKVLFPLKPLYMKFDLIIESLKWFWWLKFWFVEECRQFCGNRLSLCVSIQSQCPWVIFETSTFKSYKKQLQMFKIKGSKGGQICICPLNKHRVFRGPDSTKHISPRVLTYLTP